MIVKYSYVDRANQIRKGQQRFDKKRPHRIIERAIKSQIKDYKRGSLVIEDWED